MASSASRISATIKLTAGLRASPCGRWQVRAASISSDSEAARGADHLELLAGLVVHVGHARLDLADDLAV